MSIKEQILNLFWEVLEGSDYEVDQIKNELKMDDDLVLRFMIDSLDMVEFYVRIQDHFGFQIPQNDYTKLDSISVIENYVSKKLQASEQSA